MDAYDYCEHILATWPERWTGSVGERESGNWMEAQFAQMGYETRQTEFPCPGWEYESGKEELYLAGKKLEAGAQYFSVGCDVTAPVSIVQHDGKGGFVGEAAGKIAVVRETDTANVSERNPMLLALEKAGAVGAVMISEYDETYSTKMFRTPESKLPAMGVSGKTGEELLAGEGKEVRMVIRAKQTEDKTTSNVFGEKGPADAPRILVGAHHEAAPGSPSAFDNAAGIGIVMAIAQEFAKETVGVRLGFVGWGGHEFGAYGSCMYVKHYPEEAKRVKRLLIFDGMGVKGANPEIWTHGGAELVKSVRDVAGQMTDIKVLERTSRPGGDALCFGPIGVESVWVSDSMWKGGKYYGREDNQWKSAGPFHSPIDDMRFMDRKVLAKDVEIGVALVKRWLAELAK